MMSVKTPSKYLFTLWIFVKAHLVYMYIHRTFGEIVPFFIRYGLYMPML